MYVRRQRECPEKKKKATRQSRLFHTVTDYPGAGVIDKERKLLALYLPQNARWSQAVKYALLPGRGRYAETNHGQ